jgi:hypothetical protein
LPSMSDKGYVPSLVFSITTYGRIHLGSNFPVLSILGLHRSTRFPRSNSRNLTFGSLHALVCYWCFSKFTTAFSLSDSSTCFSSTSFGRGTVSVAVLGLRCFISFGNIAYVPYINRKGVKFVALQTIVLSPYCS